LDDVFGETPNTAGETPAPPGKTGAVRPQFCLIRSNLSAWAERMGAGKAFEDDLPRRLINGNDGELHGMKFNGLPLCGLVTLNPDQSRARLERELGR